MSLQLYYKQLRLETYEFGMHSSGCQALTMTSMCFKCLRYLQGLLKVKVHKSFIKLMVIIIQWVII
jgi:hypothetical protein